MNSETTVLILLALLLFASLVCLYFKIEEERQNKKRKFGAKDLKLHYLEILKRVDEMTGEQFEQFFIFILNVIGYNTYATKTTGDYGADSVIQIDDNLKIVAQAKRNNKKVGVAAVREVLGAIKVYHANKGIVITNNYFTSNAHQLASCNDIELWDRSTLIELIEKAQHESGLY